MDLSNPASVIVPTVDADVLSVLTGTNRPLTGRDVARLSRHSQRGVQNVLNRMADYGLLDVTEAGSARLYLLNRDHVAADVAIGLSELTARLFGRIRTHLAQWHPAPVSAAVFGSAARGDGHAESDIDLLVVRPADVDEADASWAAAVDDLSRSILRWSGNHASIVQASQAQIAEMVRNGAPIVAELRADARALTDAHPLSSALEDPR